DPYVNQIAVCQMVMSQPVLVQVVREMEFGSDLRFEKGAGLLVAFVMDNGCAAAKRPSRIARPVHCLPRLRPLGSAPQVPADSRAQFGLGTVGGQAELPCECNELGLHPVVRSILGE